MCPEWSARGFISMEVTPSMATCLHGRQMPQQQYRHMQEKTLTHWKRPWCWERLKEGGEVDDRGWDGWMAWRTQWTWVWVNSRVGNRYGALACCHPLGHKESDINGRLNWTDIFLNLNLCKLRYFFKINFQMQNCWDSGMNQIFMLVPSPGMPFTNISTCWNLNHKSLSVSYVATLWAYIQRKTWSKRIHTLQCSLQHYLQ